MTERVPTVSAVVTSYNARHFLGEAVDSVLAQTLRDWELLIADDGSTDGSPALAEDYARRDPRVRVLEHPDRVNRGASATRNLGAAAARGRYLAFLDGDDVWLPDKLEQQVALLEAHPEAVMVYGPARWWYGWTDAARNAPRDYLQPLGVPPGTVVQPPGLLQLFLGDEKVVPSMSGPLFRRQIYQRVGGSEEACRSIYDDQTVYAKVGLAGPVVVSGDCWYRYRQHRGQRNIYAPGRTRQRLAIRRAYLAWLRGYVASAGIRDRGLLRAIEAEWRPHSSPLWYGLEYAREVAGWAKKAALARLRQSA
jgi:glycosyltransferase involved in cell wall biosynthesis